MELCRCKGCCQSLPVSIETEGLGVCALNIAADDTCMDIETEKLLSTYYPDVKTSGKT